MPSHGEQDALLVVQQHAVSLISHTEDDTGAGLPRFILASLIPSLNAAYWRRQRAEPARRPDFSARAATTIADTSTMLRRSRRS